MKTRAARARQLNDRLGEVRSPEGLRRLLWPDTYFYRQQRDICESVRDNVETVCVAGNELGKDYVSAFIVLWFFLTRKPCRIVTTSATDRHLDVLWGEIGGFIARAKYPLDWKEGGPLIVNHRHLRRRVCSGPLTGKTDPISYVVGMVAKPENAESLQGHHATPDTLEEANDGMPYTLFVVDEASGVPHEYMKMASTWAKRILVIGNPWPCSNFFYHAVEGRPGSADRGGDMPRPDGDTRPGLLRKVIRITAWDSPNVRLAEAEKAGGKEPTGRIILRGVKNYDTLRDNLAKWDPVQQCVSLHAKFFKGAGVMLYPEDWVRLAHELHRKLRRAVEAGLLVRTPKAVGVDVGEGGDSSVWSCGDHLGLMSVHSAKTPDTNDVYRVSLDLMDRWGVPPHMWAFDRGGGGLEHADRLRSSGYDVRTVAFGESVSPDIRPRPPVVADRVEALEGRTTFKNRRAEVMYGLRRALNPAAGGWALPTDDEGPQYAELVRQMLPVPLTYDGDGRMYVIPKNKPTASYTGDTLTKLLGCSPDELDSVAIMRWVLDQSPRPQIDAELI